MNDPKHEDNVTLRLLEAIEERSDLSQRHLSQRLGVALGLTNSYLRRCVRKGLVKMRDAPANRYLYYLTPKGFAEKSRLTASYLSISFSFYRDASASCGRLFALCHENGWQRIALCGRSELAEIAYLRGHESGIMLSGLFDPGEPTAAFFGLDVFARVADLPASDAYFVTDLQAPAQTYRLAAQHAGSERVLVPDILGLKPIALSAVAKTESANP
jgi:DNA-binding MarR family transcriptional regulator